MSAGQNNKLNTTKQRVLYSLEKNKQQSFYGRMTESDSFVRLPEFYTDEKRPQRSKMSHRRDNQTKTSKQIVELAIEKGRQRGTTQQSSKAYEQSQIAQKIKTAHINPTQGRYNENGQRNNFHAYESFQKDLSFENLLENDTDEESRYAKQANSAPRTIKQ